MILTGLEIAKEVANKNIYIENFVREKVNPNSYNLTLNKHLLVYKLNEFTSVETDIYDNIDKNVGYLDSKQCNQTKELIIPEDGLILMPGILYLGTTNETTYTKKYAPMLEGRSSVGRLGITVHVTAGFGDIGFNGKWTLEITVTHPVKVYPNMEVCQISFNQVVGDITTYNGKYQNQSDVQASMIYQDFK